MNIDEQLRIIKRGTVDLISEAELISKLNEDRPLNIKFGIDPTAPDIHLGHTVPLQKLKQFQDAGHNIHLIIGDYTAMIGDPSGRSETRPMLTKEKITENLKTYTTQVFKILDKKKTNLLYNSDWLSKFSGEDMIKLASKYTVQQLLQRRDFNNRISENKPISVSELMYPLLVGYDSVVLKTDIELGGSDQLFNFMTSRCMQSEYGQKSEVVLILPLLEGIDGKKKMSKSLGNAIGVTEEPNNVYGKIMSIDDKLMLKYYELLSEVSINELDDIKNEITNNSVNPMIYKKKLANEIVARYHGNEKSEFARNEFERIHQRKESPKKIDTFEYSYDKKNPINLVNLIKSTQDYKNSSKGEIKRLIQQRGIKINDEVITDVNYNIETTERDFLLKIGKTYFKKIHLKENI